MCTCTRSSSVMLANKYCIGVELLKKPKREDYVSVVLT